MWFEMLTPEGEDTMEHPGDGIPVVHEPLSLDEVIHSVVVDNSSLVDQCAILSAELSSVLGELEEAQRALVAGEKKIDSYEKKVARLAQDANEFKERMIKFRSWATDLVRLRDELDQERQALRRANSELEGENAVLQNAVAELEGQIASLVGSRRYRLGSVVAEAAKRPSGLVGIGKSRRR